MTISSTEFQSSQLKCDKSIANFYDMYKTI